MIKELTVTKMEEIYDFLDENEMSSLLEGRVPEGMSTVDIFNILLKQRKLREFLQLIVDESVDVEKMSFKTMLRVLSDFFLDITNSLLTVKESLMSQLSKAVEVQNQTD